MASIKLVVYGVLGKMGHEVLSAACHTDDLEPVAAVDVTARDRTLALPDGSGSIPLSTSLDDAIGDAQVVVDFTNAEGAMAAIRTAAAHGVHVVSGSTGIPDPDLREADDLAREHRIGVIIAPNFALGAVLMMHLAKVASRFFDYAELTEMHHEAKIDAPSGTALAIAKAAAEGKGAAFTAPKAQKEIVPGTRGGQWQGVSIHSARMPGRVAHHELVFGTLGQTLAIRHDSVNRESFMPGVLMAVREVGNTRGLTFGLDKIMGL